MKSKQGTLQFLNKLDDYLLIIAVIWMGLVLTAQVWMRYVHNNPLIWSEELARYIFVWICFIGLGYGIKYDHHIKMELFFSYLPKVIQKAVSLATNLFTIVLFAMLIPSGIDFAVQVNHVPSSAMEIPMSWVYISVPIGLALGVVRLAINSLQLLTAREEVKDASING